MNFDGRPRRRHVREGVRNILLERGVAWGGGVDHAWIRLTDGFGGARGWGA